MTCARMAFLHGSRSGPGKRDHIWWTCPYPQPSIKVQRPTTYEDKCWSSAIDHGRMADSEE